MEKTHALSLVFLLLLEANFSIAQSWEALGSGMNDYVNGLAVYNGELHVSGYFTMADTTPANRVAAWNDTSFAALGSGMNHYVNALAVYQNKLFAGGWFTAAGGNLINKIAYWDGNTWSDANYSGTGHVGEMKMLNDTLYATISNQGLIKYDGNSWSSMGIGNLIYDMEIFQGELYVGGSLGSYNHIAKLDSHNNWSTVGGGTDNPVEALEVHDGKLYVGGHFTIAGGPANYIAIWDGSAWSPLGLGMDAKVHKLLSHNGKLYAAGNFTNAGGTPANRVAVWDGVSWSPFGTGMNDNVINLIIYKDRLYACGSFNFADGMVVNKIAKWNVSLSCQTNSSISETACESYTSPSGNHTWTSSAVYYDTLSNAAACDSVITIYLTINHAADSIQNITGCDSVQLNGNWYFHSQTVRDTLTGLAANGCDSLVTTILTINNSAATTISPSACDEYTSPSGQYTWTSSGTYTDTLSTINTCDSVITVNLTIDTVDTSVYQSGDTLKANAVGASYQWLDCENSHATINGATHQHYTSQTTSNYAVEVTQNGCVDTSDCHLLVISGVFDHSFSPVPDIYPNPTAGKLKIDLGKTYENITVSVTNLVGQVVATEYFEVTAAADLNIPGGRGLYFVSIHSADGKNAVVKVFRE